MSTSYELKRRRGSRSITVSVHPGGKVIVSAPYFVPQFAIDSFLISKKDWIEKQVSKQVNRIPVLPKAQTRQEYADYKSQALALAHNRLEYFNRVYGFTYHKVTIRNTSSRWGSCTRSGNLNFSYKIALLPKLQSDYIIVHELCHLKEFNHSKKFWDLVAITYPDYKKVRKLLHSVV